MLFCPHCGSENRGPGGTCPNPRCAGKPDAGPGPRRLSADELAEFAWLLSLVQGRPLRIGDRHWEVLDADGQVVIRVEVSDAKRQARFWATAPEMIARLMEHIEAVGQ